MAPIHQSALRDSPVLVEIFRGRDTEGSPIIECSHRGIICVMSGRGEVIYALGDPNIRVHMRSCAKPFQILPLFDLGFFDPKSKSHKPQVKQSDVPLLMSSHSSQAIHTKRVQELLDLMGLDQSALRCGIHSPVDEETRKDLQKNHQASSVLHNNCSGKHVVTWPGFSIHFYLEASTPLLLSAPSEFLNSMGVQ